jgi:hypothetical protein
MQNDDSMVQSDGNDELLEKITKALLKDFRGLEFERAGQANKTTQKEIILKKLENEDF